MRRHLMTTMVAAAAAMGISNLELGSPKNRYERRRDNLPDDIQKNKILQAKAKRIRKANARNN